MINRGPVWTSVYHNKCRQQQFSLWRVHLLFPFNKFPASSNFLSVSVVEFYFLNGRQKPVEGKLMNSNPVRKREKKNLRLLSSFTIFISTQITFYSFFFLNNRVICRKIYFFITPLLRHLSHLFGNGTWAMEHAHSIPLYNSAKIRTESGTTEGCTYQTDIIVVVVVYSLF